MNETVAFQNLLNERMRIEPTFEIHELVRLTDKKKTISKGDTTSWSFIL